MACFVWHSPSHSLECRWNAWWFSVIFCCCCSWENDKENFRGIWQLCENELNCQPSEILLVVNYSKHSPFWNNKLRKNKIWFGKSSLGSAYRKNWNYWALLFYHTERKVQQWKDCVFKYHYFQLLSK